MTCGGQVAVPARHGFGGYQQPALAKHGAGESMQQRGEQRSVSAGEPDPPAVQLTLQDHDLVAQGENLE
jgi:hypothetical protein